MRKYDPASSFDEESAKRHDHRGDEASAVAFLGELAGSGPVLELAIGTGRIALPLAKQGLRVDGIDISSAMVQRLRNKPGGQDLSVVIGDFADVAVADRYSLIFVVWNSFYNLLTQADQVRCFENVARHLLEGGSFVIEAFLPTFLYQPPGHQRVEIESIEADEVRFGLLRHDPATQTIEQSHISLAESRIRLEPVAQRYAWPSELDLMARLAGLQLKERFCGWNRETFDSKSEAHVSVYSR